MENVVSEVEVLDDGVESTEMVSTCCTSGNARN